jgi:hypothetical protein
MAVTVSAVSYDAVVPKPLELVPDLIDRHRHIRRRRPSPTPRRAPGQRRGRCTWTDDESDEFDRLYDEHTAAALAVRVHPLLEQARVEGCHAQTWDALKTAAREPVAA